MNDPRKTMLSFGRIAALALACGGALGACSTSYWYGHIQASHHLRCDKLENFEDRRRCQAETQPDKARYDKEREAAAAGGTRE